MVSTKAKVESKVALLLSPHELNNKCKLLDSMRIEKSVGNINYHVNKLDAKELSKNYSYLPTFAKDLFLQFTPEVFASIQEKLRYPLVNKR